MAPQFFETIEWKYLWKQAGRAAIVVITIPKVGFLKFTAAQG